MNDSFLQFRPFNVFLQDLVCLLTECEFKWLETLLSNLNAIILGIIGVLF